MSLGAVKPVRPSARAGRASGTRATLVDALGAVSGVLASGSSPDVATAGSAWPRWVQTTYAGKLCDVARDEFDVYVVLPADYLETTVDEGDTFRDAIEPALWAVAVITYSEPVAIQFNDQQTMPGLRFRVSL